jgi:hypothetical protein
MPPKFTKETLLQLLGALNEQLKRKDITAEICIVGGAAMIIAFGSRESTEDIDALLLKPSSVREAIRQVAENKGLPENWLNDGAKGFASGEQTEMTELLNLSHLRVISPSPEYILAMKCIAARTGLDKGDKADAKFLVNHLGLKSTEQVLRVVEKFYPRTRIPAKTQYFVEEIVNELNQPAQDRQ